MTGVSGPRSAAAVVGGEETSDADAENSRSTIARYEEEDEQDEEDETGIIVDTDPRSPLERFRSAPRKPLSVTDLVSPAWCELQYFYVLRSKYGRKRRTPAMKQGSAVHRVLQDAEQRSVPVRTHSREERWALRVWNVLQGLRALRETGHTRELELWGVIDGVVVNGVVDELSYECPAGADELEALEGAGGGGPGHDMEEEEHRVELGLEAERATAQTKVMADNAVGEGSIEKTAAGDASGPVKRRGRRKKALDDGSGGGDAAQEAAAAAADVAATSATTGSKPRRRKQKGSPLAASAPSSSTSQLDGADDGKAGDSDIKMKNTDSDGGSNNSSSGSSSGSSRSDSGDGSDTRKVYITDVKTRSSPHLPKNAAIRPTVMQLHIYHRLLSDLAAGAVDTAALFARYQLDPLAPLSEEFVAAVSALESEWDVEDGDGIVALGGGGSDDSDNGGDADYVPSQSPAASSVSSSRARRLRRRENAEHPQSQEERSSGGGDEDGSQDVRSADKVSTSASTGTAVAADSGSSLSLSPSPSASQTPTPTPAIEGVEEAESLEARQYHSSSSPADNDTTSTTAAAAAAATAPLFQQQQQQQQPPRQPTTLLTLWRRLQRAVRMTLPRGRASVGAVLRVEYRRAADGAVLGERLLAHDGARAARYLRDALAWWRGARAAAGVPVEEAFKCRACEFAPRCAWRAGKVDEAVARFRARHPRARSTV
jgi:hypothetical protein